MDRKERIVDIVENSIYITPVELASKLDMDVGEVNKIVDELEKSHDLAVTKNGRITLASTMGTFKGVLEAKQGGYAFLRTPDGMRDVFIGARDRGGAMNGETVLVKLKRRQKAGENPEGKVVQILSGEPADIVGTLKKNGKNAVVVSDDRNVDDVYIPKEHLNRAKNNQKVVVRIAKRALPGRMAEGRVVEVLGKTGDPGVDILAYARKYGLNAQFDRKCEEQAEALLGNELSIEGRMDFRKEMIMTIDGADAKDLDDAVSLRMLPNGHYLLGVHIADVSHYVKENSVLDEEALRRGTSVYLVDQVVPMLPKALSNNLCSLHPGEDKYTLSCMMELNGAGRLVNRALVDSMIRSTYRMTYDDVNRILEGDVRLRGMYGEITGLLEQMNALAKMLRARRFEDGSIDFDLSEAKIQLGDDGIPIQIGVRERGDAEKLIEEFMLKCNVTVAEYFHEKNVPFLYRIHEQPDEEKMYELAVFLRNFGIQLKGVEDIQPRDIQKMLLDVEGTEQVNVVNSVTLRSLKKARYAVTPVAHFGLAADQYCHFTSPIRRYPDLMVHRIVKMWLHKKMTDKAKAHLESVLPGIASKTSERERNAIEAERAVQNLKMAEYMARHIGEEYDGVVSGVTRFGIFVELENTIEGMVPLAEMIDDYYAYHEKLYCVIGERTKKKITLGDKIRVRMVSADVAAGKIEFGLPE